MQLRRNSYIRKIKRETSQKIGERKKKKGIKRVEGGRPNQYGVGYRYGKIYIEK